MSKSTTRIGILGSGIIPRSAGFRVGFCALFEKGAFEFNTEFKGGPPQNTFRFFPDGGDPETVSVHETNPYEKELRHFASCLRGEANPELLDARWARDALMLSLETQRSLQEHQTITIARRDPK
jgi:predicted dehydrogenase